MKKTQILPLFQVDAFTSELFKGNPAAVCMLDSSDWLPDAIMQKIAAENNLSETAFILKQGADFGIRWFSPTVEIDLCGHATLASAHVLFNYYNYAGNKVNFRTQKRGWVSVKKNGVALTLDFPVDIYQETTVSNSMITALGCTPVVAYKGRTDYLLLFNTQEEIESCQPDFKLLGQTEARGIIISAPGQAEGIDFVSRFFAPQCGIDEDPVTGSAHTFLTPVWSEKLNKKVLKAKQLSQRQGDLVCELEKGRVKITGRAVTYLVGTIYF